MYNTSVYVVNYLHWVIRKVNLQHLVDMCK